MSEYQLTAGIIEHNVATNWDQAKMAVYPRRRVLTDRQNAAKEKINHEMRARGATWR